MHVKKMQLEVIKRVAECKQDEFNTLAEERSILLQQVNDHLIPKTLPTMPNEIIARIFSFLYWTEDGKQDGDDTHPWRHFPDKFENQKPTVQSFLEDHGTSLDWRNLIEREVPVAVACLGTKYAIKENVNLVGAHPREIPMIEMDANRNSEALFKRPSITIIATLTGNSTLLEDLEPIRHYPWRNFILSVRGRSISQDNKGIVRTFVRDYGQKLAELDCLVIYPFHHDIVSAPGGILPCEVRDFEGHGILASKLQVARLPPTLLPTLRPILNNVTALETGVTVFPLTVRTDMKNLLKMLEPCLNSLISLTLTCMHSNCLPEILDEDFLAFYRLIEITPRRLVPRLPLRSQGILSHSRDLNDSTSFLSRKIHSKTCCLPWIAHPSPIFPPPYHNRVTFPSRSRPLVTA